MIQNPQEANFKYMNKFFFLIKIIFFYLLIASNLASKESNYYNEGIKLFENKKYSESKILFERDIVFNPKNERSYLYLAKIYHKDEKISEEEINLNTVLLLNPQNDEALYMLILLKIKKFDYKGAKNLVTKFNVVCKTFCSKKNEIKEKFDKFNPNNEKSYN